MLPTHMDPFALKSQAAQGFTYHAVNPTVGTAVALTTATRTSFLATEAALLLTNSDAPGDVARIIVLDYLRLIVAAAGTASTSFSAVVQVDSKARYASGGTSLTPVAARRDMLRTPAGVVYSGPVTLAAASGGTAGVFNTAKLKTQTAPCLVVGDEFTLRFDGSPVGNGLTSGAAAAQYEKGLGAVVIPPGGCAAIHLFGPAMSAAPTFEFDLGYTERLIP